MISEKNKKPNFFIVGAPKCGTTAMYHYLGQHPEIFILTSPPEAMESILGGKKEFHFFGSDLNFNRCSKQEYLDNFSAAKQEKRIGESSVFYLYSREAAREIKEFCPSANIIIMLRNPVDLIYSWHSQLVFWGDEDIPKFENALNAEALRKRGLNFPKKHDHPIECLFYRDIPRFTEQIKRYFHVFGREKVHIILFDDFKKKTSNTYKSVLRFLDVDDDFEVQFKIVNSNKSIRNKSWQDFLRVPPSMIRKIGKIFIPSSVYRSIRAELLHKNIKYETRPPMPPSLRKKLQADFASEIEQLSNLLNQDLTHWNSP